MPRQKHIKHNAIAFIRIEVHICHCKSLTDVHTEIYDRVEDVNARINILIEQHHRYGLAPYIFMKNRHHYIRAQIRRYMYATEESYIIVEPIYLRECRDDPILREELSRRTNPYYPRDRFPLPLSGPQFPNDRY